MALAGCLSTPPTPLPQAAEPTPPEVAPAPVAEAPLPPRPVRKPPTRTLASLPPPASSPAPAAPTGDGAAGGAALDDFSRLTGLDQDETLAVLGEPQQRAESPPAVLWRYTSSACELDLYFYLDLESREMRVLHYEFRDNDGSDRSGEKCYSELVAPHGTD